MKMHIAALLTALVLVAPATSLAQQWPGPSGNYGYGQNNQGDHDGDDRNDRDGRGNHGNHSCVNPAGNERGWCKHNRGNCYNNQNGYPYPNQYGNCPSGYQNGYNATLHGVITGISGSRVTILEGFQSISFDASQAFQYGRVNGNLYPSRTITAQGYYDQGGYFHATMIS